MRNSWLLFCTCYWHWQISWHAISWQLTLRLYSFVNGVTRWRHERDLVAFPGTSYNVCNNFLVDTSKLKQARKLTFGCSKFDKTAVQNLPTRIYLLKKSGDQVDKIIGQLQWLPILLRKTWRLSIFQWLQISVSLKSPIDRLVIQKKAPIVICNAHDVISEVTFAVNTLMSDNYFLIPSSIKDNSTYLSF